MPFSYCRKSERMFGSCENIQTFVQRTAHERNWSVFPLARPLYAKFLRLLAGHLFFSFSRNSKRKHRSFSTARGRARAAVFSTQTLYANFSRLLAAFYMRSFFPESQAGAPTGTPSILYMQNFCDF